jgi:hypothetical protein
MSPSSSSSAAQARTHARAHSPTQWDTHTRREPSRNLAAHGCVAERERARARREGAQDNNRIEWRRIHNMMVIWWDDGGGTICIPPHRPIITTTMLLNRCKPFQEEHLWWKVMDSTPREQRRVAQARTMTTSCRQQQQVQVNQSFPYVPKERFRNCTRTHTHTQLRVRGRGNIHHVAISNRVLSHRAHYYIAAARSSVNLSCTHIRKSIFDNQTHKAFCKVFDWTTQNEWSNDATATVNVVVVVVVVPLLPTRLSIAPQSVSTS